MSLRLYEIPDALRAIDERAEDNGGEISDEMLAEIEALELTLAAKVDAVSALIFEAERFVEAANEERARIERLAAVKRNKANRLRDYLLETLGRLDRKKVEGSLFTIRRQANGQPTIRWVRAPECLPDEFRRVTVTPDIARVKEMLARGEDLPEGFTSERGSHLRIS